MPSGAATAEILQFPPIEEQLLDGRVVGQIGQTLLQVGLEIEAEQIPDPESGEQTSRWFNADDIPALHSARLQAEAEHDEIYEQRMAHVREGNVTSVPIEVDPVTAGDMVNEARRLYGEDSWQCREKRAGLVLNSQRFLGETASKIGPEYFDFVWQPYDVTADDYISFGTASSEVTRNGITPLAEEHEAPRRKYDHSETVINLELGRSIGGFALRAAEVELDIDADDGQVVKGAFLPAELRNAEAVSCITINELPTAIKRRWLEDEAKGIVRPYAYGGYAPQDDRLMIRRIRYTKGSNGREFEQVAVSGKCNTHEVIQKWWVAQKVMSQEQAADVTQDDAQKVRIVVAGDVSALDVNQQLDAISSELYGKNIFMGEEVPDDHPKDYDAFPAEAAARQAKLEDAAEKLADYVEALSSQGVDHFLANGYYEKYAKELMLNLAETDIDLAARTFSVQTAVIFQEAINAAADGNPQLAAQLILEARAAAPPLEGCGAGSCDLVAIPEASSEAAMADKAGLKGEKLRYTKSICKECNAVGTLLFDMQGNAFCTGTGCHASKIDGNIKHGKKNSEHALLKLFDVSKPKAKKVKMLETSQA